MLPIHYSCTIFSLLLSSREINGSCHCPSSSPNPFHRSWDVIPDGFWKFFTLKFFLLHSEYIFLNFFELFIWFLYPSVSELGSVELHTSPAHWLWWDGHRIFFISVQKQLGRIVRQLGMIVTCGYSPGGGCSESLSFHFPSPFCLHMERGWVCHRGSQSLSPFWIHSGGEVGICTLFIVVNDHRVIEWFGLGGS